MSARIMSDETLDHVYPGIGRLNYFLARVGLAVAMVGLVIYFGPGSSVVKVAGLVVMVAGFVLDVMRLRNIGVSQWFAMLRLVPYAGTLLAIGMQSAQTGWIESRRLDRAGFVIVGVHLALIAFFIYMLFWAQTAGIGLV